MAIDIRFDQFINDPRVWQAFVNENMAFFGTTAGNALMDQLMAVRKRYRDIEKHVAKYPSSTFNWQHEKEKLKTSWQGLRTQIRTNPENPANPASPLNPANAAAPAAPAPAAAATMSPVYLPNFAAPTSPFPRADEVRDMTYDPGLGGFLSPNQWQPGVPVAATPPAPVMPPYMPPAPLPGPAPGGVGIGPGYYGQPPVNVNTGVGTAGGAWNR